MNTHRRRIGAAFAAALLAALTLTATPAFASPTDPLEVRTAQVLASHPGGEEIAPGVISWGKGAIVLTLEGAVTTRAIGTCATGQYCAWSGTSYTGTKLAFSACSSGGTSSSLSLLSGLARSTANARTSGRVDAVSGGSVIYSMSANTGRPTNGITLSALVCYN